MSLSENINALATRLASEIKLLRADLAAKYSSTNKVPIAGLSATGSPGTTTYLRGDGTWATVSSPGPTTPTAHASTHASGGSDALTLAISQITDLSNQLAAKYSGDNKVPMSSLNATGTPSASTFLRGDGTWAAPTAAAPANMVTTDTAQTLSGEKTINNLKAGQLDVGGGMYIFGAAALTSAGGIYASGIFDNYNRVYSASNPPPAPPSPSNMLTTNTYQDITGQKIFAPGTLKIVSPGGQQAVPYSDASPPQVLNLKENAGAPVYIPYNGEVSLYSDDGKKLMMKNDAGEVITVGPSSGAGGVEVYKVAADRAFTTVTLSDITDWTHLLQPGEVNTFDAMLYFSSAAAQTGFQFSVTPQNASTGAIITPLRYMAVLEYQTSATAWASFTQQVPGTPMAVTTASYVANSAMLCRISAQIELAANSVPVNIKFQVRSEVAGSAITVRKGSPLRVL